MDEKSPEPKPWTVLAEFSTEAAAEAFQSLYDHGLPPEAQPIYRPVLLDHGTTNFMFLDANTSAWVWLAMKQAASLYPDQYAALVEETEAWLDAHEPDWRATHLP